MSAGLMFGVAGALLLAVFAVTYAIARRVDNFGLVDVLWSFAFGGLIVFYALAGTGWAPRRALLGAMVLGWSLRLGTHLGVRVLGHLDREDTRYQRLRREWQPRFHAKMFGFYLMQGVSVAVLGLGFLPPVQFNRPEFRPIEMLGAALWLIAISGEALADWQLGRFKRDPAHRGQICDRGLWRWSRHPNYFFEALIWVSFLVFALGSPGGWIGIVGPAGILWLLLRVTGIPMAEQQSIQRHGDAYRRYQQTTSALVPWFPRDRPSRRIP